MAQPGDTVEIRLVHDDGYLDYIKGKIIQRTFTKTVNLGSNNQRKVQWTGWFVRIDRYYWKAGIPQHKKDPSKYNRNFFVYNNKTYVPYFEFEDTSKWIITVV